MTETPARIRWTDSCNSPDEPASTGHVGDLEALFKIWPPEDPGDEWLLTTTLPGMLEAQCYSYPDDLKLEAEHWLTGFVTSLGAIFPAALRSEVESMRGDKYQLAGDHEESGHDWQPERCYGAVEALDWMLATIDRMAANPAPAGEE